MSLREEIIADFLKIGFLKYTDLKNGFLLKRGDLSVIIDLKLLPLEENYSFYTKEQNNIMLESEVVYRFFIGNRNDLENSLLEFEKYTSGNFWNDIKSIKGDRSLVDPSPLEKNFEIIFENVYGKENINLLNREYGICNINGTTSFIDYVLFKKDKLVAIEQDGQSYHHPSILGLFKYKRQLIKQNSIVAQGSVVFRWTTEDMLSIENFENEIKKYLGDIKQYHTTNIKLNREVKLYQHQEDILKILKTKNKNESHLVVLPTGTGKTQIIISFVKHIKGKTCILVPTKNLMFQHIESFSKITNNVGGDLNNDIIIQTYSWMIRNYFELKQDYFKYLVVDEAHHAVSPSLHKVINHFTPDLLIGLTATPERLDKKKLSKIFGEYESNLSLKEAIQKKLLAPIRVFRIKSNVDLSDVRYNGKDYLISDLQRTVLVPSRDKLIVDTIKKAFIDSDMPKKSGIIFCVNVKHAESIANLMRQEGISAESVSGKDNASLEKIELYKEGKIQFLCACSLISEGWDAPRTSIVVMARPTMSKVLYLQQIGRGTRNYIDKEALYILDVVDNYAAYNKPWSVNSIFNVNKYLAWGDLFKIKGQTNNEEIILSGLYEYARKIEEIDIFTFEQKYANYLNIEQLSRELFISTGTLRTWIKKQEVMPDKKIPFGNKEIFFFEPNSVNNIRKLKNLREHGEDTIYDDFWDFINKGDYSFSYKIIFLLSIIEKMNELGECNLDNLLKFYREFYLERLKLNLAVDKNNCPYKNINNLNNDSYLKQSILSNPFEKFERKRFMFNSKDLNQIEFSNILFDKLNNKELLKIKRKLLDDLKKYYEQLGGIEQKWVKSIMIN